MGALADAVGAMLSGATHRRGAARMEDAMRALPPVDESANLLEEIAAAAH